MEVVKLRKISVFNNFLTNNEISAIKDEISSLLGDWQHIDEGWCSFDRLWMDELFNNRRNDSIILKTIQNKLWSDKMLEFYSKHEDGSYQVMPQTNFHETQVTSYKSGDGFKWHKDTYNAIGGTRVMSYILYLGNEDSFEGGGLSVNESMFGKDRPSHADF